VCKSAAIEGTLAIVSVFRAAGFGAPPVHSLAVEYCIH